MLGALKGTVVAVSQNTSSTEGGGWWLVSFFLNLYCIPLCNFSERAEAWVHLGWRRGQPVGN